MAMATAFPSGERGSIWMSRSALLRNAGGAVFGVAVGLLTLGERGSASQYTPPSVRDAAGAGPVKIAAPVIAPPQPATPSESIAADAPVRIRGRVGDGLYPSLLLAGVSPADARSFLDVVARRLDLARDVGPDDNFDLILSPRTNAASLLLYAAIERPGTSDLQVMRWSVDGRFDWLDTDMRGEGRSAAARPVSGPMTSGYGPRFHPILRFTRMHQGLDFAARAGTPVAATLDGVVSRAGWAGGYGRQVRIEHGDGMATSYSHMSGFAVAPGGHVHAGQIIGYVGSSGLSTGPHLHYELFRNGIPIDPAGVRFGRRSPLAGPELARFQSEYDQLMTLAVRPTHRG